jgi:type IX secretion system PorP/SprF family membrane protein
MTGLQNIRRIGGAFLLLAAAVLPAKAQYDVHYTNYWALQRFYNPAAAGKDAMLNVEAAYAAQMTGFENAPKVMYIGADLPLFFWGPQHGVGAAFFSDKIGLFTHQRLYLQYAYHKQNILDGTLSIGVQAGVLSENFDGSGLELEESNDPAFSSSTATGSGFDVSFGLYYQHRKGAYVGVSMAHALSPTILLGTDKTNEISISPTYYLLAGHNIKLRVPFFSIQPSVFLSTDFVAYRADATCRVTYTDDKRNVYAGLSYSPSNSISLLLGGDFHGVSLGYSYEMYTTSAMTMGNGSHELIVGYKTELDVAKKGKNRHKSIRIL